MADTIQPYNCTGSSNSREQDWGLQPGPGGTTIDSIEVRNPYLPAIENIWSSDESQLNAKDYTGISPFQPDLLQASLPSTANHSHTTTPNLPDAGEHWNQKADEGDASFTLEPTQAGQIQILASTCHQPPLPTLKNTAALASTPRIQVILRDIFPIDKDLAVFMARLRNGGMPRSDLNLLYQADPDPDSVIKYFTIFKNSILLHHPFLPTSELDAMMNQYLSWRQPVSGHAAHSWPILDPATTIATHACVYLVLGMGRWNTDQVLDRTGAGYLSRAMRTLGTELAGTTIRHVWAFIAAAIFYGSLGLPFESWTYLSVAEKILEYSIIQELGDIEGFANHPVAGNEYENKVASAFWACFCLESNLVTHHDFLPSTLLRYGRTMPFPNPSLLGLPQDRITGYLSQIYWYRFAYFGHKEHLPWPLNNSIAPVAPSTDILAHWICVGYWDAQLIPHKQKLEEILNTPDYQPLDETSLNTFGLVIESAISIKSLCKFGRISCGNIATITHSQWFNLMAITTCYNHPSLQHLIVRGIVQRGITLHGLISDTISFIRANESFFSTRMKEYARCLQGLGMKVLEMDSSLSGLRLPRTKQG